MIEFHRGKGIALQRHEVVESNLSLDQALSLSDVVITGVPTPHFKMDIEKLKEGVVAINFSSFKNFDRDNIISKASIFVPSVGKVTVSMLIRNLFRLFEYQVENA
jgi:methylenetetrahydrofolate dehydrogenase (NAD+)